MEQRNWSLKDEHEFSTRRMIESTVIEDRYDLSSTTLSKQTCHGIHHLPLLIIIISVIILKGLNLPRAWPMYLQESLLIILTLLCIIVDMYYHRMEPLTWYRMNYSTRMEPVVEVLVIFIGLLFTMSAPIAVLTNMNFDIGPKVKHDLL
jgi:hypothetical protein